jgi:hypothetical protein
MNLDLITLPKLAMESGYTEHAIRSKIARGDFAEGVHFIKAPDGRIHFYLQEYYKWVVSKNTAAAYKLRLPGKGNDTDQL